MFMSKNIVGDDLILRSANPEQDPPAINGFIVDHILKEAENIANENEDAVFCADAGRYHQSDEI